MTALVEAATMQAVNKCHNLNHCWLVYSQNSVNPFRVNTFLRHIDKTREVERSLIVLRQSIYCNRENLAGNEHNQIKS
jgi:hypothetical protein